MLLSCVQATLFWLTHLDCTQFPKEALHNRPALLRDFVVTGKLKVEQLPLACSATAVLVTAVCQHGSSRLPQSRCKTVTLYGPVRLASLYTCTDRTRRSSACTQQELN